MGKPSGSKPTSTGTDSAGPVGWCGGWPSRCRRLVVGLVLLWLLGRGAPRIVEAAWTGIGPSIGWGLLAFFCLPILGILALVTIVGIPLGLGVLAALGLIFALGYAATAWIIGRRILREPTAWILAFLAGWGILRVSRVGAHPGWLGRLGGHGRWSRRTDRGHLASRTDQPRPPRQPPDLHVLSERLSRGALEQWGGR